jgi:hypothetical protein
MADRLDCFMIGPAMAGELTFGEPYLHQPGHGLLDRSVWVGGVPRGTLSVGYTEVIDA